MVAFKRPADHSGGRPHWCRLGSTNPQTASHADDAGPEAAFNLDQPTRVLSGTPPFGNAWRRGGAGSAVFGVDALGMAGPAAAEALPALREALKTSRGREQILRAMKKIEGKQRKRID